VNVALITGGSRGIGRSIVEEFHTAGYAVAFTYAGNTAAADELVAKLGAERTAAWQANVREYERAVEVVKEVQAKFGPITALVNNAGIRKDVPLMKMDPAVWQEVIDTNLTGTFNYCRATASGMMRSGGAIVNVTSVSGVIGMAGQTNYGASKAGIIGFTKALAKEMVRFGVRVNAIAPGFIETEMTASMDDAVRKKLYAQIPMGEPGSAQDVAKLVLYLAGDGARYITGQTWNMDGGLT
jgi:3-oxoacyl-[acyl-carrier protein] reductase